MKAPILILLFAVVTGCADFRYYSQAVRGHVKLLAGREKIATLLQDAAIEPRLKQRLQLVEEVRAFAFSELKLPQTGSYRSYVQLQRHYVLQNLFAAPEFSTQLLSWCYPIAGCASYRGYFDAQLLERAAARLRQQEYDIYIGNVGAYSTLGWFDDPLPSTVIYRPEAQLIGLIFHEMAHERLYIQDDTVFNESFATALERSGVERWYTERGASEQFAQYNDRQQIREKVITLIEQTRTELQNLYDQAFAALANPASGLNDHEKVQLREDKQRLLDGAVRHYEELDAEEQRLSGYSHWFDSGLNNAKIGSVAAYHSLVPVFLKILRSNDGDYTRFYSDVETIGNLSAQDRRRCLDKLSSAGGSETAKPFALSEIAACRKM